MAALDHPLAVAQANFLLTRNLIKLLNISGAMSAGELTSLISGTIASAEASEMHDAAEVLRGLRWDLKAYPDEG